MVIVNDLLNPRAIGHRNARTHEKAHVAIVSTLTLGLNADAPLRVRLVVCNRFRR